MNILSVSGKQAGNLLLGGGLKGVYLLHRGAKHVGEISCGRRASGSASGEGSTGCAGDAAQ
jgi:hypothetical protein